MIPVVLVPYVQQSDAARLVLNISVGAFVVGDSRRRCACDVAPPTPTWSRRRCSGRCFFGAILLFPIGRVVAPDAAISGGVWIFSLGVLIGWFGLLLRWWSFVTLGKYFTVVLQTSEDQPVVDRGPYRLLRHPSYAGMLLAFVGYGLMGGNWLSAVSSVAMVLAALMYRIRIEERALIAVLGDRYRAFATGRARLVPFLW